MLNGRGDCGSKVQRTTGIEPSHGKNTSAKSPYSSYPETIAQWGRILSGEPVFNRLLPAYIPSSCLIWDQGLVSFCF